MDVFKKKQILNRSSQLICTGAHLVRGLSMRENTKRMKERKRRNYEPELLKPVIMRMNERERLEN